MDAIEVIKLKAKKNPKSVIYPEGEDERVIQAARRALDEGIISKAALLGDIDVMRNKAKKLNVALDNIDLIDPRKSEKLNEFANIFCEIRKHKGLLLEQSVEIVQQNLYFAGISVRVGLYDGFVGGSVNTTGETVRAALYTLGLSKDVRTLSSFFIMQVPNCDYGKNGLFLFADCGVVPDPTAVKVAEITNNTVNSYKAFFDEDPICALLSYSTKGSAEGDSVTKMREALAILNDRYPEIIVDGELQLDAAIVPSISNSKAPNSSVKGQANILIFPDLASGNIAYKLVERLAKATAVGPILAGMQYPANDLSRGCSVLDIVSASAVTVLQASIKA